MCCYVKDSCQICIHSESKQMQKPEHLYISTIYRLQSFGKSFHIYHYLRNCSLVTRSGWMEKQHCTAQLINNLFRFAARKQASLPTQRGQVWLVVVVVVVVVVLPQFLVTQTPLLFWEAAQHSQFIIYAECIIFPSRCSWQLLSTINTPTLLPAWAGAGGDVLRSPSIMQLCGTSEKFIKSQKVLIKLMHFFISISTWAFVIIHDLIGNISGAVTRIELDTIIQLLRFLIFQSSECVLKRFILK